RSVENKKRAKSHDRANKENPAPHVQGQNPFAPRSGLLTHQIVSSGINAKRKGWSAVGHQVDPENLCRQEGENNGFAFSLKADYRSEHDPKEHCHNLADVAAQQIPEKLSNVVEDPASFFHCMNDGGEVIIRQHLICCLL